MKNSCCGFSVKSLTTHDLCKTGLCQRKWAEVGYVWTAIKAQRLNSFIKNEKESF